jgi:hypothetical protein
MSEDQNVRVFGMKRQKADGFSSSSGFSSISVSERLYMECIQTSVQKQFNVGAFEGGMPYMFYPGFLRIVYVFRGRVLEKIGPKKLGILGGIIVGGGWILSVFSGSDTQHMASGYHLRRYCRSRSRPRLWWTIAVATDGSR